MKNSLYLIECNLTDENLLAAIKLAGFSIELRALNVSCNNITSRGVELLIQAFSLFLLDINANAIDDSVLVTLTNYSTLRILNISNNAITNKGIRVLSQHANLIHLMLDSTQITDESLKYIAKMLTLQMLDVADNDISDQGIIYLSESKSIRSVNLKGNKITDRGAEILARMGTVSLNLKYNKIADKGVLVLILSPILKTLNIKYNAINLHCQAIIHENNPIKIANAARREGLTSDVPTLKKIGLFCVKQYMTDPTVRDAVLTLLPDDLIEELQCITDLNL
jgi:hypothetical protein